MNINGKPHIVNTIVTTSHSVDNLILTFKPEETRHAVESSETVPRYIVEVKGHGENLSLDWYQTPNVPEGLKLEFETEVRRRMVARGVWISQVEGLVDRVEEWSKELDWSTRRIEKQIGDSYIGPYRVHSLLMQEGLSRVLLEPIGRLDYDAQGVVDFYLLPGYDDIARFFLIDDQWLLYRDSPGDLIKGSGNLPLSKESIRQVLEELRTHAS